MIVFSDLDGTLLDHHTYSYAEAEPAMAQLRRFGIPLVLVTSKTKAEVEVLRAQMGNVDPFIVENGGAAVIPGRADMVFGARTEVAREALRQAAASSGARVRGFSDMAIEEICERSGLRPEVAELASQREYSEPFVLLEGDEQALARALEERGFQLTRGGRFFHVLGGCDKAVAVRAVAEALGGGDTVGLGDAPNDIGFLQAMRRAVILPSAHLETMRHALPGAIVAPEAGPAGWNRAVLALLF